MLFYAHSHLNIIHHRDIKDKIFVCTLYALDLNFVLLNILYLNELDYF